MSFWKNPPKSATSEPSTSGYPRPTTEAYSVDIPQSPLDRFGKVKSALSAGTSINGKLSFDTSVRIDGNLAGEVNSQEMLVVGKQGMVEARINTGILVVEGQVKGDITARERIEVLPGGVLSGNIQTAGFVLHEGALFNGECKMVI